MFLWKVIVDHFDSLFKTCVLSSADVADPYRTPEKGTQLLEKRKKRREDGGAKSDRVGESPEILIFSNLIRSAVVLYPFVV